MYKNGDRVYVENFFIMGYGTITKALESFVFVLLDGESEELYFNFNEIKKVD